MRPEKEKLIAEFGEQYRRLIEDSLKWLKEREPVWQLDEPIDRHEFIKDLISRVVKEQ